MIVDGICANCGRSLSNATEIGSSSLYDPNGEDFELCMACWDAQELLIENNTNFQPDLLARYYATFGAARPKLYDVIGDKWV